MSYPAWVEGLVNMIKKKPPKTLSNYQPQDHLILLWKKPGSKKRTHPCELPLVMSSNSWFLQCQVDTCCPIKQWNHIATNRTGLEDKELSVQHANHVAFKKLTQQSYDRTEIEDLLNWLLLYITTMDTFWGNCQSCWKIFLLN